MPQLRRAKKRKKKVAEKQDRQMKSINQKWNMLFSSLMLISTSLISCNQKKEAQANQFAAFASSNADHAKITTTKDYKITKVSDGDTFWCQDENGKRIKVRLIGIDAPEPRNYFHKKEQPFGKESSKYAQKLLQNKSVKLELDVNPLDQYGRTLAYAYFADGTLINEKIIKEGYAVLMTIPPNVKYQQRFVDAQQYARDHQLGLWNKE